MSVNADYAAEANEAAKNAIANKDKYDKVETAT